jgi:hypothetical protein
MVEDEWQHRTRREGEAARWLKMMTDLALEKNARPMAQTRLAWETDIGAGRGGRTCTSSYTGWLFGWTLQRTRRQRSHQHLMPSLEVPHGCRGCDRDDGVLRIQWFQWRLRYLLCEQADWGTHRCNARAMGRSCGVYRTTVRTRDLVTARTGTARTQRLDYGRDRLQSICRTCIRHSPATAPF